MSTNRTPSPWRPSRRTFLQSGLAGAGAALAGSRARAATPAPPNFLVIVTDQLGMDALSAHGCPDVHTPNIDRLVRRGVTFVESHSTNPVCSPARSSIFTGRMPVETGVISNSRPIHDSVPNMGQWLSRAGYDTAYCGKWHLPGGYPVDIPGFSVFPVGAGQGDLVDNIVSRTSEGYLRNRTAKAPFLLVSSLLQPHDICYWAIHGKRLVPEELPFPEIAGQLPELPPNHRARPAAPAKLAERIYEGFSDLQWRYYLYIYYRQIEMADAEIGRILDALDDTGLADNTVVIFTADHGDGRGRHMHVSKWYPYEEAVKVPLVVSCPGRLAEGVRDDTHLVSGLDIMSTVCDLAGVAPPEHLRGRSLRPLLEGLPAEWREFVCAEIQIVGRMLRTERYKYVIYEDDPVEQLFDMKADPWETKNLYDDAACADVLADHRRLLAEWQARLRPVPPTRDYEHPGQWRRQQQRKGA
ncbi:MAG: sulfatase-like hydrolase/transferase [Candidatus Hydrogenedentes bacterium]|nr:sulfatase-like hydrolase/transferase [Candidatus Hydrogenedentota bacterium]